MMKKNPFMSLWLSGANSAAAAGRGAWTREFYRLQRTMTEETVRFWTGMSRPRAAGNAKSPTTKRR
jgi:hypothetical protein